MVVRLRPGGSTDTVLLNWDGRLLSDRLLAGSNWELLTGFGPWAGITFDSLSRCWFVTWVDVICPGSGVLTTSGG